MGSFAACRRRRRVNDLLPLIEALAALAVQDYLTAEPNNDAGQGATSSEPVLPDVGKAA